MSIFDGLKGNRAESLARRPAGAGAGPGERSTGAAGSSMANRQYEGRRSLGNASRIKIERIVPDPDQPRKTFEPDALNRLAENMRIKGQLVPILVRWDGTADRYVVIDGERRFRAATVAKLPELAVVVEDESDPDAILEMQLITNALREGVAPVEQAKAWDRLRESQGLSFRELAAKLGYDHSSVVKAMDLLKLTPEIQAKVDAGEIAASTAGHLAKLPAEDQGHLADRIATEGLSRSEVVEEVRRVETARPKSSPGKAKPRGTGPKPVTARTFKGAGGLKITAERAKGIDLGALADALEAAAAMVRAEIAGAKGRGGDPA